MVEFIPIVHPPPPMARGVAPGRAARVGGRRQARFDPLRHSAGVVPLVGVRMRRTKPRPQQCEARAGKVGHNSPSPRPQAVDDETVVRAFAVSDDHSSRLRPKRRPQRPGPLVPLASRRAAAAAACAWTVSLQSREPTMRAWWFAVQRLLPADHPSPAQHSRLNSRLRPCNLASRSPPKNRDAPP